MLYLAMSCFQGRTQEAAFEALLRHQPAGVQLTPGNLPSPCFRRLVQDYLDRGGQIRLHHGFAWDRYRAPVFDASGRPLFTEPHRSLHPPRALARPRAGRAPTRAWTLSEWLPIAVEYDLIWETMVPSWLLGNGAELERAMAAGLQLAVDVSHLFIQQCQGVLSEEVLRRVFAYDRIAEVHVSQNNGRSDQHRAIHSDTPHLAWVRERLGELPVVLESYWHRVSEHDQSAQLDLLRE